MISDLLSESRTILDYYALIVAILGGVISFGLEFGDPLLRPEFFVLGISIAWLVIIPLLLIKAKMTPTQRLLLRAAIHILVWLFTAWFSFGGLMGGVQDLSIVMNISWIGSIVMTFLTPIIWGILVSKVVKNYRKSIP